MLCNRTHVAKGFGVGRFPAQEFRPTWETVAKLSLNLYRKAVAALEQCVATKPVLGTLQEGGASFQTTHWTEISHARQAESSNNRPKRDTWLCDGETMRAFFVGNERSL